MEKSSCKPRNPWTQIQDPGNLGIKKRAEKECITISTTLTVGKALYIVNPRCFDLILPGNVVPLDGLVPKTVFQCHWGGKSKAYETEGNIRLSYVPKKGLKLEVREGRDWPWRNPVKGNWIQRRGLGCVADAAGSDETFYLRAVNSSE